VEVKAGGDDS